MTNFERIKAMDLESLARILEGDCCFCAYQGKHCWDNDQVYCDEGTIKWLKQESCEEN